MTIDHAIALLELAVRNKAQLIAHVRRFQEEVFHDESLSGPAADALRDLAYDLEYYEPDPGRRCEDPALFDDTRAMKEIVDTLSRIRGLSGT